MIDSNIPDDWDCPQWKLHGQPRNWKSYATDLLIEEWPNFDDPEKKTIASMLNDIYCDILKGRFTVIKR